MSAALQAPATTAPAAAPAAGAAQQPGAANALRDSAGYAAQQAQVRPQVRVTASALNVRSTPKVASNNKVGTLLRGAVKHVHGDAQGWLQIEHNGSTRAYISGAYVEPLQVQGPAAPPVVTPGPVDDVQAEQPAPQAPAPAGPVAAPAEQTAAPDTQAPRREVRITASTLNVRSAPVVASGNELGQLRTGQVVEVLSEADGWLRIRFEGSDQAYISGRYTSPVSGPAAATGPQSEEVTDANTRFGTIVSQLVSDYQNVPVWRRGQAQTEPPAATFVTPYVLNDPASVQTALAAQRNTHQGLATRSGGTVSAATGNRPFIGKGTPEETQVVAQAAIDAGLTTPQGIQAYVNNGPMNSSGNRRNGRWGIDCSGLTAIAVSEMAGGARTVAGNIRSTEYRPGGSALRTGGYTQITGDNALAGDVVSYMSTNHVVVVFERQDTTIQNSQGQSRSAIRLRVGEASGGGIRSTMTYWYVPGALRYAGTAARTTPDVTLATRNDNGANSPSWSTHNNGIQVTGAGFGSGNFSIVRPPANQRAIDQARTERAQQASNTTNVGPQ